MSIGQLAKRGSVRRRRRSDGAQRTDRRSVARRLSGHRLRGRRVVSRRRQIAHADLHHPRRADAGPVRDSIILKELNAQHYPAPIFIISGVGDIPMAVEAIKNGALDFIEKPFDAATVVTRVREAVEAWSRRASATAATSCRSAFPGHDLLTSRERDVLGADRRRLVEQAGRPRARHLPAHHRGASRAHHGKARRQECRRSVRIVLSDAAAPETPAAAWLRCDEAI